MIPTKHYCVFVSFCFNWINSREAAQSYASHITENGQIIYHSRDGQDKDT